MIYILLYDDIDWSMMLNHCSKFPFYVLRKVVDARAGPGTKSMYKIKNRNNKELPEDHSIMKKKHKHKHRKRPSASQVHNSSKVPLSPGGMLDDITG